MTSTKDNPRICETCKRPETDHAFRHPFRHNGVDDELVKSRDDKASDDAAAHDNGAQGRVRIMPAGDPVIRLLLIRKGIISVEDIEQIEAELRATGVAGHDPSQSLG